MTRAPETVRTAIAPLARLPAFFDLKGKRAVVAGGSDAAAWKVELLSAAGARVEVFAAVPSEGMLALASTPPDGADCYPSTRLGGARSAWRCHCRRRLRRRQSGCAICRRCAQRRRAGQCHRPAGLLRFFIRRDRQSLAACHWDFYGGCCAGFRLRRSAPRSKR